MAGYKLSKSTYLKGMQCEKSLYLNKYQPKDRTPFSKETLQLFDKGRAFEEKFRGQFANAIDVKKILGMKFDQYQLFTASVLATHEAVTVFEAGFIYEDVLVLTDVLRKNQDESYVVYEIKSSADLSDVILQDLAVQYYVCNSQLKNIKSFNLVLRKGEDDYEILDMTKQLKKQVKYVKNNIARFNNILDDISAPAVTMGPQCSVPYKCDFIAYCERALNSFRSREMTTEPQ